MRWRLFLAFACAVIGAGCFWIAGSIWHTLLDKSLEMSFIGITSLLWSVCMAQDDGGYTSLK